jgi:hypothetical protein
MYKLIFLLAFPFLMESCSKETTQLSFAGAAEYLPLLPGKFITYRLDSTVFVRLGTQKEIHSYIVQDKIDSVIQNNLGQQAFKMVRSVRNPSDTTRWTPFQYYLITPTGKAMELVQDNLRYIQLVSPIIEGSSWKGNSYINTTGVPGLFYLDGWEYAYKNTGQPAVVANKIYPQTITVLQHNDTIGNPNNKNAYYEINYGSEIYAKAIGLIYKELHHEVWQPPNGSSTSGYYEPGSFGIKLSIINHNF